MTRGNWWTEEENQKKETSNDAALLTFTSRTTGVLLRRRSNTSNAGIFALNLLTSHHAALWFAKTRENKGKLVSE